MRAPPRPVPRKHLLPGEVARLLAVAADQVEIATENMAAAPENGRLVEALFVAEQTRLLSGWPPTPAPAGAKWPCSAWPISTAAC
jgi:hypothetical protein